jgi:transposase
VVTSNNEVIEKNLGFRICLNVEIDLKTEHSKASLQSITNKSMVSLRHFQWKRCRRTRMKQSNLRPIFVAGGVFVMSKNTYVLGCDVSKRKIDVALLEDHGKLLWYDIILNETIELTTYLLTLQGSYPEVEIECAVEATGQYHYALLDACQHASMPCRAFDPIMTKDQPSVRGKKTDKIDAVKIARIGMNGEVPIWKPEPYLTAKSLARSMQKLRKLSLSLNAHRRYLAETTALAMPTTATKAIEDIRVSITAAHEQLFTELIRSTQGEVYRLLQTIPGVGPLTATSVIAEIQDMSRFTKACRLVACVGLDFPVKQSGETSRRGKHLTKRGSSHLRRSLFIAASVARQHDPYFRSIYEKKRAEGKTYKAAVIAVEGVRC